MKKYVLVTLADNNFIDQAKQLFSSAYHNGGWRDDMLLLTNNLSDSESKEFTEQGILIKKCKPIKKVDNTRFSDIILCKYYLFSDYFTKWDNVIFLDADIIVQASLDDLKKVKGFNATKDFANLQGQFAPNLTTPVIPELSIIYEKYYEAFNVGMMAFSTDIIKKNLFDKIIDLHVKLGKYALFPEQAIFNIIFKDKWTKLSRMYALSPSCLWDKHRIKSNKLKGVTIHFEGVHENCKPWNETNVFNKIWLDNLKKFPEINKENNFCKVKKYSKFEIMFWGGYYYGFFDGLKYLLKSMIKKLLNILHIHPNTFK